MNPKGFTSSIDWSHEVVASALWVLLAFGGAAVALLAILAILGWFTEWGRQFRRITGDYFTGRESVPVWVAAAALLLSAVVSVRISVLLSYYTNDLYSSLQAAFQGRPGDAVRQSGIDGFWFAMVVFAVLATTSMSRYLVDVYLSQRFVLRWRVWLTRRFVDEWLDRHAYFRGQLAATPIDNPDQRIQQDIDIVTAGTGQTNTPDHSSGEMLLFGAVEALLAVGSFGVILWQLSGPLTVVGVTIPRALFWIVIVYVLSATAVAFWIGRPLIRFSFFNEMRNASFRYAMIRLKDSASAVGLYRGENVERTQLRDKLFDVADNYRRWLNRMMLFLGFNGTVGQAIAPLPYLVQAQRLFAGRISFGDVMQSATAFHAIHDSLSFFRNAYDRFASYRAALIRLDGLRETIDRSRALPRLTPQASTDDAVRLANVDVRTPDGQPLIRALTLSLDMGESLLIKGPSGSGKTVLLESVAGLWPYASGDVHLPTDGRDTMFLPQLPYLPMGDLRAVASYPLPSGSVSDGDVQRALLQVALPHLIIRIKESRDWAKSLSVGEQQRLAFARILLSRPKAVFLDESTSAMDEGLELMLYQVVRAELPKAILVSVSHRDSVEQHHGQQLELIGDGEWRLERLGSST